MICKRYPGRRPSEYLKVEDEYLAFQVDLALALRGLQREEIITNHRLQVTHWYILQVCRALGAKGVPKQPPNIPNLKPKKDKNNGLPSLGQVMSMVGGKGTILRKKYGN